MNYIAFTNARTYSSRSAFRFTGCNDGAAMTALAPVLKPMY